MLELISKNTKWCQEENHNNEFNDVKNIFKQILQVFHPIITGIHIVNCDVSSYAISRVLYQCDKKGEHKVIAHVNRPLKGAEINYFKSEQEILAFFIV